MPAETTSNYFQTYLNQPPFQDLVVTTNGDQQLLQPEIQAYLYEEERNSRINEICKHDLTHIHRATRNGLVLLDLLQTNPIAADITPDQVTTTLALHDIGYGSNNLLARRYHVRGHEKESWNIVTKLAQTLSPDNATRQCIEDPHNLIRAGILGTAKNYRKIIRDAIDHPNSNNLFALLIAAADKTDYFVRDRVEHLTSPQYMKNPYHTLAHAVNTYDLEINSHEQTLTYTANLHKSEPFFENPALWQRYAEECFPQVFGLLEAVANIAGYRFVVDVQ